MLKGAAVGVAGFAASLFGGSRLLSGARAQSPQPQGWPELSDPQVRKGFERLNDWDEHVRECRRIGVECLGFEQALDLMAENFGAEGEEEFLEHVAAKASPFHYDHYRDLASIASETGYEESDLFNDLYARMDAAGEIEGATAEVDETELHLLGVNREPAGHGRAPKETGTTRKIVEAEAGADDRIIGVQDEIDVLANDDDGIYGTTIQGNDPTNVSVQFDYARYDGASGAHEDAQAAVVVHKHWVTEGCVHERNWETFLVDAWDLPQEEPLSFRVEPNEENTTAWRVQLFGEHVRDATVRTAYVPGQG